MPPMASRNKANNGPGDAQTVARCSESSESGATADRRGRAPGRLRDSPHVAITDRSGPLGSTASPAAQHDAYRLDFERGSTVAGAGSCRCSPRTSAPPRADSPTPTTRAPR